MEETGHKRVWTRWEWERNSVPSHSHPFITTYKLRGEGRATSSITWITSSCATPGSTVIFTTSQRERSPSRQKCRVNEHGPTRRFRNTTSENHAGSDGFT